MKFIRLSFRKMIKTIFKIHILYRNVSKPLQRTYLITELITWKDYEIQIGAYNSKGTGSYSQAIKVKTREGRPSAPPTNVRAQAVESTVVKVRERE